MKTFVWIILGILAFYVLLLIIDLIFVFTFKIILRKHERGFAVILATKKENIKKMMDLMRSRGVKIDNQYHVMLNEINPHDFDHQDTKECKKARDTLSYLNDVILKPLLDSEKLINNPEFELAKSNITEQDRIYHRYVAMYNADILGFNYWIRFWPWRYIFILLDIKTKEII